MKLISRKRDEKFRHRGTVEKVLRCESTKDHVDLLLGINNHNDSSNKRRDVPKPWKYGKGLTQWKHRRLCLSVVGY